MRRKSVFSKWTLFLTVVLLCPYVYSRPQDTSPTSVSDSAHVDKPTENPIRYIYRNDSINSRFKLPVLTNIYVSPSENTFSSITNNSNKSSSALNAFRDHINSSNTTNRKSRLITKKIVTNSKRNNKINKNSFISQITNPKQDKENRKKTEIKKVITKWTDNTKYEDFNLTYETTLSNEVGKNQFTTSSTESIEELSSTETVNDYSTEVSKKYDHRKPMKQLLNKIKNKVHNRPKPQYSEEHIQSDNIYVTAGYPYPSTRPIYVFNTPTPTPIITNVGNPKPWSKPPNFQVVYQNPTTPRPVVVKKPLKNHYNNHNPIYNYPHYPGHEFEVTTFQPANAYTDRIVIRPEEYAASPDECPTIFLTLNNTFQGQAKEACPDLNIAVNTNVVNKNVVVESDEEEPDGLFSDPFGLPFSDESGDESGNNDHSYDSNENQEQVESASIEGLALTNYNAASDGDSAEPGGFGSPSSVLSSLSRPGRPHDDDDETFNFSSIIQFFKPAINAMGWLATINPLSFGLFSMLLAPIVFLFAGTSGIAALFAPWAFSAREAPKIVHVYRPYWHWDNEMKTWHLHSFPHNRKWNPSLPRSSSEANSTNLRSARPTLFYNLKELIKSITHKLRQNNTNKISNEGNRKNKRKKRETWTIRIK